MQINCVITAILPKKMISCFSRPGMMLMFIFFIACVYPTGKVTAQCQSGQINVDGNPCDWNNLSEFSTKSYVRDAFGNGVLDSQFTQGSKDFIPALENRWEVGQTKAKNDIANGSAVLIGDVLFFAGDRTSNKGDAQIGFWFLLNGTRPVDSVGTKLFSPEHADGDLLVLADFTGGGRDANVIVLRWNGNGMGTYPNSDGNLDLVTVAAAVAINNKDTYPVPGSWSFIKPNYDVNEFYEGFVNLGDLGPNANRCFSAFMLETRSSQSITASLDDFVTGGFNAKPAAPTVTPQGRCGVGSLTLTAACTGSEIRWYNALDAVTPISSNSTYTVSGNSLTILNLVATTTFYAACYNTELKCESTRTAVEAIVNPIPVAYAGADRALTCTTTSIILNGSSSAPGNDFAWLPSNGGHISSGVNTATPTVDQAGTYTLTVTDPATGCTGTDEALVLLNNIPPYVNAGENKILTCITTSVALSGSFAEVAGAPINPVQQGPLAFVFQWVASNGGHIVSGANTLTPIVDAPGTYVITATNPANGCTATDTAKVFSSAFYVYAGPDKVLTCLNTQTVLEGEILSGGINPVQQRVAFPGFEFEWVASNGGNIVSGADTEFPIVNAAGTYTLTVTNTATGCTATDVAVVSFIGTSPDVDAGPNKVICSGESVLLAGSSATSGVGFAWTASNGGHIVSGGSTASATVDAAGIYTLIVTDPANGCTATDFAEVMVNSVDAGSIAGDQVVCFTDPGPLPFRNEVPATGSGDITYQWVSNTAGCNGPWTSIPGATAPDFDSFVLPLSLDTYYKRVSISTLNGVICRDSSNCVAILSGPCSGPFPFAGCTYTQGYFGNKNGNSCDGENFYESPVSLITALLFDPLIVGRGDRERSITIPALEAGAIKLNSILPGGKSANMLPSGNCNIADNTCIGQYLTNQGKLNNVLLSQTIVLSLNARINGGVLAGLPITNGWLTTRDQKGCGESATEVGCIAGGEAIRSILMNENVANYLTDFEENTADVNDLIELANDLLGGALFPGQVGANGNVIPSYSDVNAAIDAVNNAFDGCRTGLGYYECPKNCDNLTLSCEPLMALKKPGKPVTSKPRESEFGAKQLKVVAYPNPFVDAVNLKVKSPVSGLARIELFDPTGTRLSVSTRYLVAGVETIIGLKGIIPAASLHYRLSIGGYTASGIAIKLK